MRINKDLIISDTGLSLEDIAYKDVYSTNELKTNKVWIDGSPIYRKVYRNISVNQSYDLDISGLSIKEITDIKYRHFDGVSTYDINNRYGVWAGTEQYCRLFFRAINPTTLQLRSSFETANFNYIILEYTKTTD